VVITVTNPNTGEPQSNVEVAVSYRFMGVANPPRDARGVTDKDGKVILEIADFTQGGIQLDVGDSVFMLEPEVVREGGNVRWWRGYDDHEKQPYSVVLAANGRL
jgi:hypothetical protein